MNGGSVSYRAVIERKILDDETSEIVVSCRLGKGLQRRCRLHDRQCGHYGHLSNSAVGWR
jgi:hypothetical protein